jgi:DNA-binding NarL/FixJ family response regulator
MNDARPLRVAIADDALLLREGIAKVLEDGGLDVVASVGTGDEVLEVVRGGDVDAAVLDIRMPPSYRDEGIAALEAMRAEGSTIGVLLLSMYATPEYALRVMGASGGSVVDPEVVEQLVKRTRADDPLSRLTERERSVLELMAQGYSNGGIAQTLFLGLKTVETHVRSILQKLDLEESPEHHRRVLAVLTLLGER